MLRAKKGNRVVRIPDEKMDEYKALGYTITDMSGKMIYEHVEPSKKLEKAEKKIAALEKENAALKEELARVSATKQAAAEPAEEAPAATAGKSKKGKASGGTE